MNYNEKRLGDRHVKLINYFVFFQKYVIKISLQEIITFLLKQQNGSYFLHLPQIIQHNECYRFIQQAKAMKQLEDTVDDCG